MTRERADEIFFPKKVEEPDESSVILRASPVVEPGIPLHVCCCREKPGQQVVRFFAGTGELMRDGGAEGFGT